MVPAPKKSAVVTLRTAMLCRRVCDVPPTAHIRPGALILCPLLNRGFKPPISLVKPPSGGLGYKMRKSPGGFCRGAPLCPLFLVFGLGTHCRAYTSEHPIPPPSHVQRCEPPLVSASDSEKPAEKHGGNIGGKDRDALHRQRPSISLKKTLDCSGFQIQVSQSADSEHVRPRQALETIYQVRKTMPDGLPTGV